MMMVDLGPRCQIRNRRWWKSKDQRRFRQSNLEPLQQNQFYWNGKNYIIARVMVFDGKGVNLKRPVRRPWKACFGRAVYLSLFSVKASATPSRLKIARQLSAFEMIRAPLRIKAMTQQVPPLAAPFFRNFASVVSCFCPSIPSKKIIIIQARKEIEGVRGSTIYI